MSYTYKPPPIITQPDTCIPIPFIRSFIHSVLCGRQLCVRDACKFLAWSLIGDREVFFIEGGATFFEEGLRSCVESYVVFVRGATFQIEGLRFSRSVGTVTCVRGLAGTECTSTYYTYSTVRTDSRTGPLFVGDYELHSTSTVLHAIHIPTSASSWFHYLYKYSYLLYLFCVPFRISPP